MMFYCARRLARASGCLNSARRSFAATSLVQKGSKRAAESSPKPTSRRRLAVDLAPSSSRGTSKGLLEVAPRTRPKKHQPKEPDRPSFERDSIPHEGKELAPQNRLRASTSPRPSRRRRRTDEEAENRWRWKKVRESSEDSAKEQSSVSAPQPTASITSSSKGRSKPSLPPPVQEHATSPTHGKASRNPIPSDLVSTTPLDDAQELPDRFASPPLTEGLLQSLEEIIGVDAQPTPIQALSLKHLFHHMPKDPAQPPKDSSWREYLLASETGSGKSMAYLLPMLQSLKDTEQDPPPPGVDTKQFPLNPRAIVLAPTHELSRQLSTFAKGLLHNMKLRVLCASRANIPGTQRSTGTASQMARRYTDMEDDGSSLHLAARARPIDVLVGTPNKVLEMVKGRGWDWEKRQAERSSGQENEQPRTRTNWRPARPEMGLARVEWVIVDEADVLFDPDFQESTRLLLADVAAARGAPVEYQPSQPSLTLQPTESEEAQEDSNIISYPFHLILTSATIPASLAAYLDKHHPSLVRLASPNLHHLPKTLQTEFAGFRSGNRNADVEQRVRRVWADDAAAGHSRSRVLIFCNRSSKVDELGAYLEEKGVFNVALTSSNDARKRGSNLHLKGFLRPVKAKDKKASEMSDNDDFESQQENAETAVETTPNPAQESDPHVMITTSLLSRGLDFSPSIRHVFIMDEPRNMIDFLHRAGRSGRAGERGKVVIFGRLKGRGSEATKEVRKKVGLLRA